MSQPDEELRRRLADLAESAGPWADPLPAVMRHAHAEPRHRRALPAGRRKWSLAAAVVITLVVGIALAMQMCQRPAPQDGPASNKADHARSQTTGACRCRRVRRIRLCHRGANTRSRHASTALALGEIPPWA